MAASPAPSSVPATGASVPWSNVERFIGLFTHDLRNGLNAVELHLTLLGEMSDDPLVKDEVKRVRASVADLTRQLQSARTRTGAPTPHLFLYPAVEFVEDFRERFERRHPEHSARVRWEIEPGAGSLSIDPELSMAALLELLDNSLLYATKGSQVDVRVHGGADGMTLTIRQPSDSAPSGPSHEWGKTPLSSSRRDGYGLGAFHARRIIEMQKGTLEFTWSEGDRCVVTSIVLPGAAADDTASR